MAWRFNSETKKLAYYDTVEEANAANGEKKMPIFATKEELTIAKISTKDLVMIYNDNIEAGEPQIAGFKNRDAGVTVVWALINGEPIPADNVKPVKPEPTPKAPKGQGRPAGFGRYNDKKLYPTKDANPRREGSFGWRSMNIIHENPGISTKEFLEKGGRIRDLHWDVERGQARVE